MNEGRKEGKKEGRKEGRKREGFVVINMKLYGFDECEVHKTYLTSESENKKRLTVIIAV